MNQTYQNWELIVVDDGSTDNSLELLRQVARQNSRMIVEERPSHISKGANSCRNLGFRLAKGEFVKWVDSDDLLVVGALSKQVRIMTMDPRVKVCFGQGVFFNDLSEKKEERWARSIHSDELMWDYIRNNVRWPIGGPLWRRDFFSQAPFHEGLQNSQEWLMHGLQLLRLQPHEYTIIEDDVYLIRRGNQRMSSSRNARYYFNQAKARKILLDASGKSSVSVRFKLELLKQIFIYGFHSFSNRLSGRS